MSKDTRYLNLTELENFSKAISDKLQGRLEYKTTLSLRPAGSTTRTDWNDIINLNNPSLVGDCYLLQGTGTGDYVEVNGVKYFHDEYILCTNVVDKDDTGTLSDDIEIMKFGGGAVDIDNKTILDHNDDGTYAQLHTRVGGWLDDSWISSQTTQFILTDSADQYSFTNDKMYNTWGAKVPTKVTVTITERDTGNIIFDEEKNINNISEWEDSIIFVTSEVDFALFKTNTNGLFRVFLAHFTTGYNKLVEIAIKVDAGIIHYIDTDYIKINNTTIASEKVLSTDEVKTLRAKSALEVDSLSGITSPLTETIYRLTAEETISGKTYLPGEYVYDAATGWIHLNCYEIIDKMYDTSGSTPVLIPGVKEKLYYLTTFQRVFIDGKTYTKTPGLYGWNGTDYFNTAINFDEKTIKTIPDVGAYSVPAKTAIGGYRNTNSTDGVDFLETFTTDANGAIVNQTITPTKLYMNVVVNRMNRNKPVFFVLKNATNGDKYLEGELSIYPTAAASAANSTFEVKGDNLYFKVVYIEAGAGTYSMTLNVPKEAGLTPDTTYTFAIKYTTVDYHYVNNRFIEMDNTTITDVNPLDKTIGPLHAKSAIEVTKLPSTDILPETIYHLTESYTDDYGYFKIKGLYVYDSSKQFVNLKWTRIGGDTPDNKTIRQYRNYDTFKKYSGLHTDVSLYRKFTSDKTLISTETAAIEFTHTALRTTLTFPLTYDGGLDLTKDNLSVVYEDIVITDTTGKKWEVPGMILHACLYTNKDKITFGASEVDYYNNNNIQMEIIRDTATSTMDATINIEGLTTNDFDDVASAKIAKLYFGTQKYDNYNMLDAGFVQTDETTIVKERHGINSARNLFGLALRAKSAIETDKLSTITSPFTETIYRLTQDEIIGTQKFKAGLYVYDSTNWIPVSGLVELKEEGGLDKDIDGKIFINIKTDDTSTTKNINSGLIINSDNYLKINVDDSLKVPAGENILSVNLKNSTLELDKRGLSTALKTYRIPNSGEIILAEKELEVNPGGFGSEYYFCKIDYADLKKEFWKCDILEITEIKYADGTSYTKTIELPFDGSYNREFWILDEYPEYYGTVYIKYLNSNYFNIYILNKHEAYKEGVDISKIKLVGICSNKRQINPNWIKLYKSGGLKTVSEKDNYGLSLNIKSGSDLFINSNNELDINSVTSKFPVFNWIDNAWNFGGGFTNEQIIYGGATGAFTGRYYTKGGYANSPMEKFNGILNVASGDGPLVGKMSSYADYVFTGNRIADINSIPDDMYMHNGEMVKYTGTYSGKIFYRTVWEYSYLDTDGTLKTGSYYDGQNYFPITDKWQMLDLCSNHTIGEARDYIINTQGRNFVKFTGVYTHGPWFTDGPKLLTVNDSVDICMPFVTFSPLKKLNTWPTNPGYGITISTDVPTDGKYGDVNYVITT